MLHVACHFHHTRTSFETCKISDRHYTMQSVDLVWGLGLRVWDLGLDDCGGKSECVICGLQLRDDDCSLCFEDHGPFLNGAVGANWMIKTLATSFQVRWSVLRMKLVRVFVFTIQVLPGNPAVRHYLLRCSRASAQSINWTITPITEIPQNRKPHHKPQTWRGMPKMTCAKEFEVLMTLPPPPLSVGMMIP